MIRETPQFHTTPLAHVTTNMEVVVWTTAQDPYLQYSRRLHQSRYFPSHVRSNKISKSHIQHTQEAPKVSINNSFLKGRGSSHLLKGGKTLSQACWFSTNTPYCAPAAQYQNV